MKILVTTPTGTIGRRIVRELLAPEFSVRVLAREPVSLGEEVRTQVEVITGSMADEATLGRALEGVEAMFFCVPPASRQARNVVGHYERFASAAARAIRKAGPPQVVTISAFGCRQAHQAGPISALGLMEDLLNQTGAALWHLRCGSFMENFLAQTQAIVGRGVIALPLPGHIAIPMVAATDIAEVALRWLVRRDWSGIAGVPVLGPNDLSYHQAAAIIERVLARPVRYQEIAANAFVQSLVNRGASPEYAQSLVAMFAALAGSSTAKDRPGRNAASSTHLGDWVREELAPLVGRSIVGSGMGCTA